MPSISVIVPVYNARSFLRPCLDSIMSQTFKEWELILVDDASTNETPAICRQYIEMEPDKIKYVRLDANHGLSHARNTGVAMAKSPYVVFLDDDDCYAPFALETLYKLAKGNDAEIAVGQFVNVTDNPFKGNSKLPDKPNVRIVDGITALKEILYQTTNLHASACAKIFRTELLLLTPFAEGMWYEDLELCSRLLPGRRCIAVTGTPLYFYRRNPSSFINTWSPRRLHALTATDRILETVSKNCPECIAAAESRRFSANFNIFLLASLNGDTGTADRCWETIVAQRKNCLMDSNVRLKNRIGALLSYLGRRACLAAFRLK